MDPIERIDITKDTSFVFIRESRTAATTTSTAASPTSRSTVGAWWCARRPSRPTSRASTPSRAVDWLLADDFHAVLRRGPAVRHRLLSSPQFVEPHRPRAHVVQQR
jgi:hypothetical protein